jgi:hypothetical protein
MKSKRKRLRERTKPPMGPTGNREPCGMGMCGLRDTESESSYFHLLNSLDYYGVSPLIRLQVARSCNAVGISSNPITAKNITARTAGVRCGGTPCRSSSPG